MKKTIIKFSNVSKTYGGFEAVKNLNLDIYSGEIFSLLGLNGAGKTSTIKMLTGLSLPSEGIIKVADYDIVKNANAAKALMGYIPDRGYLFEKLSVQELLLLCGKLYNLEKEYILERADLVLKEFFLFDQKHEYVENLSHGMRQRLVFCTAFLHQPKILVIDEPMVGLDPFGANALKTSLKNFANKGGTVFLSTHTLSVASQLSDRLGIIHNGEIIAVGSQEKIAQLTSNYQNNDLESIFLEITSQ